MILRTRRGQGEGGAAALSLIVTGMVLSLAIVLFMALPITQASDRKAANRTAADAAALAGAEAIRDNLGIALTSGPFQGSFDDYLLTIDLGQSEASEYAERNGSTLIEYDASVDGLAWEVFARVEGDPVREQDDLRPESQATARIGFPDCSTPEQEEPEPTGEPFDPDADEGDDDEGDEDDEDEPPPPLKFSCDGIDIDLDPIKRGDEWVFELGSGVIDTILDLVTVKLVR
jgi:hypothetical protein